MINVYSKVKSKFSRESKRSTSSCSETHDKEYDADYNDESDEFNQRILKKIILKRNILSPKNHHKKNATIDKNCVSPNRARYGTINQDENSMKNREKIEKTEDFKEASNRIYSLSPNNFDRTKVLAMMKNYTFKNPNQRRFISPHRRVFSNDRLIQAVNNPTDNTCHHIDMDALKKKLLSPKPSALRPKPKVSENICIEDLFCDSSFNKPLKQANQAKNRKKQLRKLISDSEITEIRNQIWQNINQKKANMEL